MLEKIHKADPRKFFDEMEEIEKAIKGDKYVEKELIVPNSSHYGEDEEDEEEKDD